MNALQFLLGSYAEFLMVLLRVSGIFIIAPVFSNTIIPFRVKGAAVLLIALISFPPLVAQNLVPSPNGLMEIAVIGAGEVFIGYVIGFITQIVITIFQVSGQFYSIQMGFGIINVFDPLAETSVPIISQLQTLLISMLFLILDAHHLVLKAVLRSYEFVPNAYGLDYGRLAWHMVSEFDRIFKVGFLIGVPLIGIVFLMTTTLGILSKLAPEMNVMIMGFGLKVTIGILTFTFLLPEFMAIASDLFRNAIQDSYRLIQVLHQ